MKVQGRRYATAAIICSTIHRCSDMCNHGDGWSKTMFEYKLELNNQVNRGKLRFRLMPFHLDPSGYHDWILNTTIPGGSGQARMKDASEPWRSDGSAVQLYDNQTLRSCTTYPGMENTPQPPRDNEASSSMFSSYCFTSSTVLSRYMTKPEGSEDWMDPSDDDSPSTWHVTDHFGELNGTLTACHWKPCVKRYKVDTTKDGFRQTETSSTLNWTYANSTIDWDDTLKPRRSVSKGCQVAILHEASTRGTISVAL